MSMFLPEQPQSQQQTSAFDPAPTPDASGDVALMQRVFEAAAKNPNQIPPDFLPYVMDWLQTQRLSIPIGQVFGFQQFLSTQVTVYISNLTVTETTTSGAYTDLTTVGPEITALPDGKYIVLVCAAAFVSGSATDGWMSYSANGDAANDGRGSRCATVNALSGIVMVSTVTLNNGGNNDLKAKYKSSDGATSALFTNRCLLAIRYDNA